MKKQLIALCSVSFIALFCAGSLKADFMDFVVVGDPCNASDTRLVRNTLWGNVNYLYKIGKYEVTNNQYVAFLCAVASKDDPHSLYNTNMANPVYPTRGGIVRGGSPGAYIYGLNGGYGDKPVNWVSWRSAARFANWMHNGMLNDSNTTEYGVYSNIDSEPTTVTHNADAKFWITTANEWYKAAFYKGGANAGYWTYTTQSNSAPVGGPLPTDPDNKKVNYQANGFDWGDGVGYGKTTFVGTYYESPGPYGTFDQGGNLYEWNEGRVPTFPATYRIRNGGSFLKDAASDVSYASMHYAIATATNNETGFRLSTIFTGCLTAFPGDLNGDCKVDFTDFALLASHWAECNLDPAEACN
ncbi:MAG: formylglycine-generating enzyme family protein [Planctomycetaceae bacterium]|nr:formylglycine-generating enzyme family protein [Planctomycetaceae bacterium]